MLRKKVQEYSSDAFLEDASSNKTNAILLHEAVRNQVTEAPYLTEAQRQELLGDLDRASDKLQNR